MKRGAASPPATHQEAPRPDASRQPAAAPEPSSAARRALPESVFRAHMAMVTAHRALRDLLKEHRTLSEQNATLFKALGSLAEGRGLPEMETGGAAAEQILPSLQRLAERLAQSADGEEVDQVHKRNELLKSENSTLVARCQELMSENNNLFKLYAASHHLHSSLHLEEVLEKISEIMLNLIGAGDYALFLFDDKERLMLPVLIKGLDGKAPAKIHLGQGPLGKILNTEQTYVSATPPQPGEVSTDNPIAAIPLRTADGFVGAIVVYGLLPQKPAFSEVDFALFDFFAAHAATAINSARLYSESERRVSKMKQFLTLMKGPEDGGPKG